MFDNNVDEVIRANPDVCGYINPDNINDTTLKWFKKNDADNYFVMTTYPYLGI